MSYHNKPKRNRKYSSAKKFKKNAQGHEERNSYARKTRMSRSTQESETREYRIDQKILDKAHKETLSQLQHWRKENAKLQQDRQKTSQNETKHKLDPWQEEALHALNSNANVIVDAPTTAGKTRVVEAFIEQHVNKADFRSCYTCPVKSLSNDKLREFRQLYGKESVGIATGDIKENLDAPIVIATLESYRNSLLGVEPDLGRNLVIFDEYHFLQDEGRGSSWEEAIILTPPGCQILMLSASLSNAHEFAEWIEKLTGRASSLISVTHRPVPLANMVWMQDSWFLSNTLPKKLFPKKRTQFLEPISMEEMVPRLTQLIELEQTPCIIYAGKRLSCNLIAQALCKELKPIERKKREEIGAVLQKAHDEYKALSFIKPSLRRMIQNFGVSFHHSGLAPLARLAIETLVKDGHLQFCVATMGLSLGINFSVKSTVISDAVRPGDSGFTPYQASEILQMTGRAGRRGRDVVGFSCWLNRKYFTKFGGTNRDPCQSRLKNDPTTFLGLISRGFSLGKIEQFYSKSFQKFKSPRVDVKLIRPDRLEKKLGVISLPCQSPCHEFSAYHEQKNSLCYDCPEKDRCHDYISDWCLEGNLSRLHEHLHKIGALNAENELSAFGELGRYFPQSGGFLVAHMISRDEINPNNLGTATQLLAALSLARYKTPETPRDYTFPFKPHEIEEHLEYFYPISLFPELYDAPNRKNRHRKAIKEFNPMAGYLVKSWLEGIAWNNLLEEVTNEYFGPGDVTGVIYRTASYLQSLSQSPCLEISSNAKMMRDQILREPLQIML